MDRYAGVLIPEKQSGVFKVSFTVLMDVVFAYAFLFSANQSCSCAQGDGGKESVFSVLVRNGFREIEVFDDLLFRVRGGQGFFIKFDIRYVRRSVDCRSDGV